MRFQISTIHVYIWFYMFWLSVTRRFNHLVVAQWNWLLGLRQRNRFADRWVLPTMFTELLKCCFTELVGLQTYTDIVLQTRQSSYIVIYNIVFLFCFEVFVLQIGVLRLKQPRKVWHPFFSVHLVKSILQKKYRYTCYVCCWLFWTFGGDKGHSSRCCRHNVIRHYYH